ncbi:hypothetical protein [Microbacterium kyungheense]|nr:hypothetical protein [Microbacterium kyungheense]
MARTSRRRSPRSHSSTAGLGEEAAGEYLRTLAADARYVRDVY